MAAQPSLIDAPECGRHAVDYPQPVSLETIAVMEQALSDMLHALRRSALGADAQRAAAIEYESWLRRDH